MCFFFFKKNKKKITLAFCKKKQQKKKNPLPQTHQPLIHHNISEDLKRIFN